MDWPHLPRCPSRGSLDPPRPGNRALHPHHHRGHPDTRRAHDGRAAQEAGARWRTEVVGTCFGSQGCTPRLGQSLRAAAQEWRCPGNSSEDPHLRGDRSLNRAPTDASCDVSTTGNKAALIGVLASAPGHRGRTPRMATTFGLSGLSRAISAGGQIGEFVPSRGLWISREEIAHLYIVHPARVGANVTKSLQSPRRRTPSQARLAVCLTEHHPQAPGRRLRGMQGSERAAIDPHRPPRFPPRWSEDHRFVRLPLLRPGNPRQGRRPGQTHSRSCQREPQVRCAVLTAVSLVSQDASTLRQTMPMPDRRPQLEIPKPLDTRLRRASPFRPSPTPRRRRRRRSWPHWSASCATPRPRGRR